MSQGPEFRGTPLLMTVHMSPRIPTFACLTLTHHLQ
uniref:Uncharacterized protein n=1 Tax=Anguilla anguilla TaxID=7936 RepID=A0A0E9THA0_ANGAN